MNGQVLAMAASALLFGATATNAAARHEITDIGTLGGIWSVATGLNDHGRVVDYGPTSGNNMSHAFLYDRGSITYLGTLEGAYNDASGINNSSQVSGDSHTLQVMDNGSLEARAYIYTDGVMINLGTLTLQLHV